MTGYRSIGLLSIAKIFDSVLSEWSCGAPAIEYLFVGLLLNEVYLFSDRVRVIQSTYSKCPEPETEYRSDCV